VILVFAAVSAWHRIETRWADHPHPQEWAQWQYDDDAVRTTGAAFCIVCGAWVAEKFRVPDDYRRAA
jgi:hypothetical protein